MEKLKKNGNGKPPKGEEKPQKELNGLKGEPESIAKRTAHVDPYKPKFQGIDKKSDHKPFANAMIIDGLKDKIEKMEKVLGKTGKKAHEEEATVERKISTNAIIVDDIMNEAVVELFKKAGDRPLRAYIKKIGTEWIGCLKSKELDRATFLISGPDGVREVEAKDGDTINVGGEAVKIHVVGGSVEWEKEK